MEISLRSGEKNNEEAEAAWQPSVHIAKKMGKVEMHSGLAAEITGSGSTYLYSLATVFSVGNWRPTFELNGDINREKEIHLTPGVLWKGFDDFELGLGISKSIRKEAHSWGIVFMITHEFYIL